MQSQKWYWKQRTNKVNKGLKYYSKKPLTFIILTVALLVFIYNKIYVDELKELNFTINDSQYSFIPVNSYTTDSILTLESFTNSRKADSVFYKNSHEEIFEILKERNEIYFSFYVWKEDNTTPFRKLLNVDPKLNYGLDVNFNYLLRSLYPNCEQNINSIRACPSIKINMFLIDLNGNIIKEEMNESILAFGGLDNEDSNVSIQLYNDEIIEMWYSHYNRYQGEIRVNKKTIKNFNGIYSEVSFYNTKTQKFTIVDKRKVFFK